MRPPKVLDAVAGLTAILLVGFLSAVASQLMNTQDVACFNPELQAWDVQLANVTIRRDGEWLVMRRGFPPHVVARVHKSRQCLALLSGFGE